MAVSICELDDFVIVHDTVCDTTAELDVLAGGATVFEISVKNPVDTFFYLFLYDNVNPTVASTEADFVWRFEKNSTNTLNEGYSTLSFGTTGIVFSDAISIAGATAAAATGDPGSSVEVTLVCKKAA